MNEEELLIDRCYSHYLGIEASLKHDFNIESRKKYFPDRKIMSRDDFETKTFGKHTVLSGQLIWKDFADRHKIK